MKHPPIGLAAVFDLETEGWDRYVLGGYLDDRGRYMSTRDPEVLANRILSTRGDVFAHNGGRYDALWLCDLLVRWGVPDVRVSLAGSRITLLEIGETRVRDSFALIPMGLAKAAPLGGMRKSETGFPCVCGEDCGGYCSIKVGMPERMFRRLDGYLENDCRATFAMIRAVLGWIDGHGFEARGTVGGTAWASAQRELDLPSAKWEASDYELARGGYYGGRVEVFRPVARSGHRYDRNSSYPAALCETPIPIGRPRRIVSAASRAYASGAEGIFEAEVSVPESFVPPLPVRLDGLAYPIGKFGGRWTGLELRYAEGCGASILRVSQAIVWPDAGRILESWCRRVWDLRAAAEPVWAAWIKWLANSLTGKLAQHPERDEVRIGPEPRKPRRVKWDAVGPSLRIWRRPVWRIPGCGHVQWSAYLTASARIELHRQMLAAGDDLLYCDTDSVYSAAELVRRIGPGLGAWKYEGAMRHWRAWAPKLYRYVAAGGARHVAAKGLSGMDYDGASAFAAGAPWSVDRGVAGFLSAAKAGGSIFRRNAIVRSSGADGLHFGSRILGPDGATLPRSFESLTSDSRLIALETEVEE